LVRGDTSSESAMQVLELLVRVPSINFNLTHSKGLTAFYYSVKIGNAST